MKVTCTGRKVTLKDAFISRTEKKMGKLDKFFSDEAEAHVTVTVEKAWQSVEITVRDKGFVVRSEKTASRMEDAFDAALDVLIRQIVKNRKRLENRVSQPAAAQTAEEEMWEEEEYAIIREKHFPIKPCSPEEAILQMNLLGHAFYLYRDAETDEINVVYRRKDGSYGILIPER